MLNVVSVQDAQKQRSMELEQGLLGGLLLDGSTVEDVVDVVRPEHMLDYAHKQIFRAIIEIHNTGNMVDVITVCDYLEAVGKADDVGGLAYLTNLASNTPSSATVGCYANRIVRNALVASLKQLLLDQVSDMDRAGSATAADLVAQLEGHISSFSNGLPSDSRTMYKLPDLFKEVVDSVNESFESGAPISGYASGFDSVDEVLNGFEKGSLYVLAARPSMGKTSLALNMAHGLAVSSNKSVLFLSLEMTAQQLGFRLLSSRAEIDSRILETGRLHGDDWPKFSSAIASMNDHKLVIDDQPGITPSMLRAKARQAQAQHGELGMIVVDYLQLMKADGKSDNRTQEVSKISQALKEIAKDFGCPVMALSQLNRNLESRPNKRPLNSDLRESGSIEQDADVVIMLYRDEVYYEDSPDKGLAEVNITKNRKGPIAKVKMRFQGQFTKFSELKRVG